MTGGSRTWTYRFMLRGAPPEMDEALVLRLYPRFSGAWRAVKESCVQNALAGQACPVPRVHVTCTDTSILGGAFLVMQLRPGAPLLNAPMEVMPDLLGRTHAALHRLDPEPVLESLRGHGGETSQHRLEGSLEALDEWIGGSPRFGPVVGWLLENRPPEPEPLSICHGDFHPLNVLAEEGEVTGVLDWCDFIAGDPAMDVACTMMLMALHGRRLLSRPDADQVAERYLAAYRASRPLGSDHFDYYRVRRAVLALTEGVGWWQHPLIVQELIAEIRSTTGIAVSEA